MATTRLPLQFRIHATLNTEHTFMLIDTGAAFSCLPKSLFSKMGGSLEPTPVILSSCSEARIPVYGEVYAEIALPDLRRQFNWYFIVADVSMPILGLDFLSHFKIIIDCGNLTITDQTTNLRSKLHEISHGSCQQLQLDIPFPNHLRDLFKDYESVVRASHSVDLKNSSVKHYIDTGSSPPPVSKVRPLFGEKLKYAKIEIDKLIKLNVIRPSKSPYASPIHLAKKNDGGYRLTGDYRNLNSITVPDRYPISLH